jgi:hypothetical protein
MPWTVRLENENGEPEDEASVVLDFGSLPVADDRSLCFQIESSRYYDTILNPFQAEILVRELDASADFTEAITALRDMAMKACKPHIYLRFVGD